MHMVRSPHFMYSHPESLHCLLMSSAKQQSHDLECPLLFKHGSLDKDGLLIYIHIPSHCAESVLRKIMSWSVH